ncbi:hypothetical protein A2U01_0040549, partial [Trifolium medium]|nr:hypothetical protein [Trifolium medium]
ILSIDDDPDTRREETHTPPTPPSLKGVALAFLLYLSISITTLLIVFLLVSNIMWTTLIKFLAFIMLGYVLDNILFSRATSAATSAIVDGTTSVAMSEAVTDGGGMSWKAFFWLVLVVLVSWL